MSFLPPFHVTGPADTQTFTTPPNAPAQQYQDTAPSFQLQSNEQDDGSSHSALSQTHQSHQPEQQQPQQQNHVSKPNTKALNAAAHQSNSTAKHSTYSTSHFSHFPAKPQSPDQTPQLPPFSMHTQEILRRVGAAAPNVSTGSAEWEAARQRVLSSMAAAPTHSTPVSSGSIQAPVRGRGRGRPRKNQGVGVPLGATRVGDPPMATNGPTTPVRGKSRGGRPRGRGRGGRPRGRKRKRDDSEDDGETSDSSSSLSVPASQTPKVEEPTVTKSGRSVTKPSAYAPPPPPIESPRAPGSGRRGFGGRRFYKKGPEFALCEKCLRGHSPATNAIVFCDGCNKCWHQWCHDPHIGQDVVEQADKEWYCETCEGRRESERLPLNQRVGGENLSADERHRYLETLSRPTLLTLLQLATDRHPETPVFAPNSQDLLSHPAGRAKIPHSSSGPSSHATTNGTTNISTSGPPSQDDDDGDPYPDFAAAAVTNDPPSTYPRPGNGPMRPRPTIDPADMDWLLDDTNGFGVFGHFYAPPGGDPAAGVGAMVPVVPGLEKGSWIQRGEADAIGKEHAEMTQETNGKAS